MQVSASRGQVVCSGSSVHVVQSSWWVRQRLPWAHWANHCVTENKTYHVSWYVCLCACACSLYARASALWFSHWQHLHPVGQKVWRADVVSLLQPGPIQTPVKNPAFQQLMLKYWLVIHSDPLKRVCVCAGSWECWWSLCVARWSATCWQSWSCTAEPDNTRQIRRRKEAMSWWTRRKQLTTLCPQEKSLRPEGTLWLTGSSRVVQRQWDSNTGGGDEGRNWEAAAAEFVHGSSRLKDFISTNCSEP